MKVGFDGSIKLEFHGANLSSNGGLLAYRDLDHALGLKENYLFQVFECFNLNLIAILLGVISPHGFDMGNIRLYKERKNYQNSKCRKKSVFLYCKKSI